METKTEARFRVVCAWCEDVLEEGDPGADISHGICGPCERGLEAEVDVSPCCTQCEAEAVHAAGDEPSPDLLERLRRPMNPVLEAWLEGMARRDAERVLEVVR